MNQEVVLGMGVVKELCKHAYSVHYVANDRYLACIGNTQVQRVIHAMAVRGKGKLVLDMCGSTNVSACHVTCPIITLATTVCHAETLG